MKRTRTLILMVWLLVAALGLAACSSQPATPPAAGDNAPQPSTGTGSQPDGEADPVKLVVWWWGEQEAPGAEAWMKETVEKFREQHPNVTVETVLQSTDQLVPAFKAAAAAQEGPDIQYFWGGIWTLEDAWAGSIVPMDGLIPADELANYINNDERFWDGKQWGIGWYLSNNTMAYRKDLFQQAGLDPANPPRTWDELLRACDQLKAKGITPIAGGVKDGWFGGWLWQMLSKQTLDSADELKQASIGEFPLTDPKFATWWSRLEESRHRGCWNDDIASLDYQQGQELFMQGKAAMVFGNDTFYPGWIQQMGADKLGVMLVPTYADGKLADTITSSAQGFGITSWSQHPQEAAAFLVFMHRPERLNAWYEKTGVLPADKRFDPANIQLDVMRQVFEWVKAKPGPNLENYAPSILDEQANFAGVQLLFAGQKSAAELAQLSEEVIGNWRSESPESVENFQKWITR